MVQTQALKALCKAKIQLIEPRADHGRPLGPNLAKFGQFDRSRTNVDRFHAKLGQLSFGRSWPTSSELRSNSGQNRPMPGLVLSNLDEFGSNLAEPGPDLAEIGRCRAKCGRLWSNS